MLVFYDIDAPKKPINVTINSDLLLKAKELKLNISSVLENALAEKVRQEKRNEWRKENADAIASYNKVIEDNGVFSDTSGTF